jgi:hypothetical protein
MVDVERKIVHLFEQIFGEYTQHQRLFMYGANYPSDENNLEKLGRKMEDGVHDSIMFQSIREPLNAMTPAEIEQLRKKLKLYGKT